MSIQHIIAPKTRKRQP